MDAKEKNELIRKGNQALNSGDVMTAGRIFKTVDYRDGLIRVGDHYYYEKMQPLMAYGYYRQAKHQKMIDRVFDGFMFALKVWLHDGAEEKSGGVEKAPPVKSIAEDIKAEMKSRSAALKKPSEVSDKILLETDAEDIRRRRSESDS